MPSTNGYGLKRFVRWCILYARVSTSEQARSGYSLAQQLEALREYAAREGYEVLEQVVDPGESGSTLERPGLDRARDLVAAGGVSVVLAQDRDRFSREPAYLYLLREEFAAHGTRIQSLNDRGDDSPEGQLTDGILDQLAKFERAKTAERSRRGKKQKARLGKILSTRPAYGFDWNAARDGYVINPEQMAVMRSIFYMAGVEGRSLCAIQQQLGEDGVPSPTGKAQWDVQSIRKLLQRDLYKPHTYPEMREIVGSDVLPRLEPGSNYGVYWFGERSESRKRVSENGEGGRVYKHRYTSRVRPVAERIGVPVPGSGIPREWIDAARANLEDNRRPANAGRRFWDLSAGILRCSECGRAMSPRTASRKYFYYTCTVGPSKRLGGCSAKKFHPATQLEERVWGEVSAILTDPKKLSTGLDEMIERESAQMLGDPVKEAAALGKRLGEIKSRRSRYQEMAATGLIDFDELRERLAAIEDERQDTERTLEASRHRTEHLERLEQNRRVLLEEYAGAMPEKLADLPPEKRHRVYRMMRLRGSLAPSGDLEMSGDVIPASFCRTETPSLLG
jgi:site-specific DNA recombinase